MSCPFYGKNSWNFIWNADQSVEATAIPAASIDLKKTFFGGMVVSCSLAFFRRPCFVCVCVEELGRKSVVGAEDCIFT